MPGPALRVLGTDTSCVGDWTLSRPPRPCQSCFGRECLAASAAKKLCHPGIPVKRRLCAPIRCRGTASPRIATRRGGFAGPSTDQARQVPGSRADVLMGSHRNPVIAAGWSDAGGGLCGIRRRNGWASTRLPLLFGRNTAAGAGCGLPASRGHGPGRCEPAQPRTGRDESRSTRFLAQLQALRQHTPVTSLRELHKLHGSVQPWEATDLARRESRARQMHQSMPIAR